MRGIKNLIARRRPMSDPAGVHDDTTEAATATDPLDDWDRLQTRLTGELPAPPRHSDLDAARAARDHVPRPERPQPNPRQEWVPKGQATPDLDDLGDLLDTSKTPEPPTQAPDGAPRIWDLDPVDSAPALTQAGSAAARSADAPSAPTAPHALAAAPAAQRVKTRLLGFHAETSEPDLFASPPATSAVAGSDPWFPVGWLVVIDGPGRGASFTLTAGLTTLGRDPEQTVTLDFGDTTISRERHVCIAYDDEENRAYVGHGGKANIVRLNDRPLLSTENLNDGDTLRIGKTVLRFVAFCHAGFSWTDADHDGNDDV